SLNIREKLRDESHSRKYTPMIYRLQAETARSRPRRREPLGAIKGFPRRYVGNPFGTSKHSDAQREGRINMFSLTGKSCVVTGASRGLGRAIALAYAAQGADLVLTARSRNDLEQLRAEVESLGRRAVVRAGDVTDMAHLRAVGQEAVSTFGRLD